MGGMLGTLTMGLTIDAFGPISDNGGGIAEMSQLDEWVRERTDVLDAAGNTTAAIGKGFAIGSAALVSLALFGAFCVRADITGVDILHPWVFTGLLFGALVSSVQLAVSMSNTGGAWDNAKKYISAGELGPDHAKGSDTHKNSVTGDTVGDPLKDTSGPALNIVMKLTAILSLVFGSAIADASNPQGGPFWMK